MMAHGNNHQPMEFPDKMSKAIAELQLVQSPERPNATEKPQLASTEKPQLVVSEDDETGSSGYESSDESVSFSEDEEEAKIVKVLVDAAFSKKLTGSTVKRLLMAGMEQEPMRKKARTCECDVSTSDASPLLAVQSCQEFKHWKKTQKPSTTKPRECLQSILQAANQVETTVSAQSLVGQFFPTTLPRYEMRAFRAVKEENVDELQRLFDEGMDFHAGNKFGETLMHAACRHGSIPVVDFMLHTAKASLKVCCDMGRTPLHDACWSVASDFDFITLLLDACPDLLYVSDNRGCTPLDYVPRDEWDAWCRFLENRGAERLVSHELP